MFGKVSVVGDTFVMSFVFLIIVSVVVTKATRWDLNRGKLGPFADVSPGFAALSMRPGNLLLSSVAFGAAGVALTVPLFVLPLLVLGDDELDLLAFCIAKVSPAAFLAMPAKALAILRVLADTAKLAPAGV